MNVFATRWRRRATIAMRLRPPPNPLLGLPRARRRAIARAVGRGEAVRDVVDAAEAVRYAQWRQRESPLAHVKHVRVAVGVVLVIEAAESIVSSGARSAWAVLAPLAYLLGHASLARIGQHRRARAAVAERLNVQLLDTYGMPLPARVRPRLRRARQQPYVRNLWLSLGAMVTAYLLVGLLVSLSVFARRGSVERLIVFACIASVALAASAFGILCALRGFRLARGRLGARAVACVYLVLSVSTGVGWIIGAVRVLLFGA